MARPRKAKSKPAEKLSEALNFIAPAAGDEGAWAHARIAANWIVAANGVLAAGHAIEEELALCPHIGRLIDALNKSGQTLALTEKDNGTLFVSGDKLRAIVPCIPGDTLAPVMPDPRIAVIDDRIKEGFAKLLPLTKEAAERTLEISILLRANSMFACNGQVIFEFWHGIDLPPGMAVPKPFCAAVTGSAKALAGFGYSATSVTFYFEDGAWIKTQLYRNDWPNVDALFEYQSFPAAVPEGLFEAVRAIESFSDDGGVHFHDEKLKSSYDNYREDGPVYGATYDVPGLQQGHSFTAKLLRLIEPVCEQLDYTSNDDRAVFFGGSVRGVIMKRVNRREEPPPAPIEYSSASNVPAFDPACGYDPNAGAWGAISRTFGVEDDDVPF